MKFATSVILSIVVLMFLSPSMETRSSLKIYTEEIKNPGKFILERVAGTWPYTVDPAINWDNFGGGIMELVYEPLVTYEGDSLVDLIGVLATNWSQSEDGKKYTFSLRQDVTFHDGVPFNAYVMKYSLDRMIIMGHPWSAQTMLANSIEGGPEYLSQAWNQDVDEALIYLEAEGICALDEFTLEFNLERPYIPFIYTLASPWFAAVSPKAVVENRPVSYTTDTTNNTFGMVPLDLWFPELENYSLLGLQANHNPSDSGVVPGSYVLIDPGPNEHVWMQEHAVGTGPFKLVERMGDYHRLRKNTNWWGTFSEDSVDEIEILEIPNVETILSDLQSGETDMIYLHWEDYDNVVNPEGKPLIDGINVHEMTDFGTLFLYMSMWNGEDNVIESNQSTYNAGTLARYSTGSETASPWNPFTALLFRKAFAYSYNYDAHINNILNGFGARLEGVIPKGMFGHHDMLIENGFIPQYDPDKAKLLFQEVGWKGTIHLGFDSGNTLKEQMWLILKNSIESLDVGIEIQVEAVDPEIYHYYYYPLILRGWLADYADPDSFVTPILHSDGMVQDINYTNHELDNMMREAAGELNRTRREQMYFDIEELAANDSPIIYVTQSRSLIITKDWIRNLESSGSLNPMKMIPNLEWIDKSYDTVPPVISDVFHTPTSPTSSDEVSVYSNISDNSGILSATVRYRINGNSWNNESMHYDDSTDSYLATLGPFDSTSQVEYYISAIDTSPLQNSAINDNNSFFYSFSVIDIVSSSTHPEPTNGASDFTGYEVVLFSFMTLIFLRFIRKKKKVNNKSQ